MFKNSDIYRELAEINSPLAEISNINAFSVPLDYFSTLSTDIISACHNKSLLAHLNKEHSIMNVPEGYFDGLADSVMHKIRAEQVADASFSETGSVLNKISRRNIFTVPAGYFERLSTDILNKVGQPAKVIPIKSRSFFKYAIAAAITGVLGFSLFSTLDKRNNVEAIAPSSSVVMTQAGQILINNSFDSELETLDDDEILHYLKNNGDDVNAALVASVTDEQILPNEDAYYTDEKTLEDFLNGLNVKNNN